MKISGFTFIRNGQLHAFPFVQSIKSLLPLVDEFIIAVGASKDHTLQMIQEINDPKIKIIETVWNDRMTIDGFVYGQQKMIAQYACTGDWAFYIEGDEVLHENDYDTIVAAMKKYHHDPNVEALVFDYLHFYGNMNTYVWSPRWYRRAARIIKTSVRSIAPDGLYWVVLDSNKKGRYPKAALVNATMYHYGWARPQDKMINKLAEVEHFWDHKNHAAGLDYRRVDAKTLRQFTGRHPSVMQDFFPMTDELFTADPNHKLTKRERKNRLALSIEDRINIDFSKKHFVLVD